MEVLPAGPAALKVAQGDAADAAGAAASVATKSTAPVFLSTLAAGPHDRRVAIAAVLVSAVSFAVLAPFARVPLPEVPAFIPVYQSTLALCNLITAVLLFGQYSILGTRGLRLLACGYLYSALMIIVHTLSFPGVFSPTGLLGAGSQTTAWLYMFWHAGFPLFVIAYTRSLRPEANPAADGGGTMPIILASVVAIITVVGACTLLVTLGRALLPPVMNGNQYAPVQVFVISTVWLFSLAALIALWRRRPRSVLDLWLMVVMCTWLFDMALGAVLNSARYDLGWYSGRIYGLLAATFILMVLVLEIRALYTRLLRATQAERVAAEGRAEQLGLANRALLDSQDELHRRSEASERRHRNLLDLTQEAIWVHSEGKIIFANPAAARFFNAGHPDALVGLPSIGWVHPDDRALAAARTEKLMASPTSVPVVEMRLMTIDGSVRTAMVHAVSFMQDDKLHVMASATDVTAQREAETQLHQAQKMESVGLLTGGIAHDFNNLLTVIIGNLDVALDRGVGELRPVLESALRASERGAALIKQMLAFSRRQVLAPEPIDLGQLTHGMEDLLRRTLGEDIEIELKPAADLWQARADKGQVESALLNLAINARDAMGSGGKLTIESRNVHLDEDYARANVEMTPGDYVVLAVTDTGSGMAPDVAKRAFEPFFTTKAVGKGTGLGLSMIYGFAKQSGGHLKIYSEVGHGTTIRLYLPRYVGEAVRGGVHPRQSAAEPSHKSRASETILVVEDEAPVRNLVVNQLRELGYQVIEAPDGPAARAILAGNQPIDLLMTDVVMPGGMTGGQLAEIAQQLRPGLKTLFSSGYTQNSIAHQGKLEPGVEFLSKPFRRTDLARKVREILDGAG
jgi:PAS domain S-box-containing protein